MLPLLMISRSRQGSGFYHIIKNNSRACLKNKNCTKRMFYFPFHDKIKKKGGSLC